MRLNTRARFRLLTVLAAAPAATAAAAVGPAVVADAASSTPTISSKASAFVSTNGDILAERVLSVNGVRAIAIGGSFSSIVTESGSTKAAANFAVIRQSNGKVLYAAPSISSAGYVRALTSRSGVIYLGGSFTSFAGSARAHVAALSTSTWKLTSWAPNIGSTVRALAAGKNYVFAAGNASAVTAYGRSSGSLVWSKAVSGGLVKGLQISKATQGLYVAGYFDAIGGFSNHGLIELKLGTGAPITSFQPSFLPNNQPGADPTYNGEDPFSMSLVTISGTSYLAVATGGTHNYIRLLSKTSGAFQWSHATVGDAQAVTTVGNSVVVGYHRWRANGGSVNWPYFAGQLTSTGSLTSWDPHLSGTQTLADQGGNGTMALAYDSTSHTLFVGGAFTTYNATCHLATSASCSGGTHLQSLAAYAVTP